MLESLFSTTTEESLTLLNMLTALISSMCFGTLISFIYMKTHRKEGYSKSFALTLIMLPGIISVVIMLIGSNVARAFSLAGAFSLIRFRSAPGDSKDIAYVFFTLGVGLACGMGYILYGFLFALIMCLSVLVLESVNFGRSNSASMQLKITVPEDLNFEGIFDDILSKYADSWKLNKIKTTSFGTLFELTYLIELRKQVTQKNLIDELRCRNGNLTVILTLNGDNNTAIKM